MFHGHYDAILKFSSEGELSEELARAKVEYFERTGELFESDENFERRMASFLEWYVFDREIPDHPGLTPAKLYARQQEEVAPDHERPRISEVAAALPSLFEYRKVKADRLHAIDLLSNNRLQVFERREPAGLDSGDILEARLVEFDGEHYFTEVWCTHPREARAPVIKAAKRFRKGDSSFAARVDLIHRVARLSNRCERYKHVSPKQIFSELE